MLAVSIQDDGIYSTHIRCSVAEHKPNYQDLHYFVCFDFTCTVFVCLSVCLSAFIIHVFSYHSAKSRIMEAYDVAYHENHHAVNGLGKLS